MRTPIETPESSALSAVGEVCGLPSRDASSDATKNGTESPLVHVIDISKSFGGVHALTKVNLTIGRGQVHALCGENGAGKSTLIRILSGIYPPDEGRVLIDNREVHAALGADAECGVSVIYQESVACPDLDACDNIFVGREPTKYGGVVLDRRKMERHAEELLSGLGQTFDVSIPLASLPMAQRQMVAIARALSNRCRLLIMDEPTASLSARETDVLFRVIDRLRAQGVTILYVSHRMEEVFALADLATVLRDGHHVATRPTSELSPSSLVSLMVGREVEPLGCSPTKQADSGSATLEVRGLSLAGSFSDISFRLRPGEVVGLAGLVGAGRSELATAIFGATKYESGEVYVNGRRLPPGTIAKSIEHGVALVPEDRQHLGLILPMSVITNLCLTVLRSLTHWGIVSRSKEKETAGSMAAALGVRAARLSMPAEMLSGGNQQKLVLGKWLAAKPQVLMLDEPTRGVDVAAKTEIHRRIRKLAEGGLATLVISSELPELLTVADRILVMRQGRLSGELTREEATEEKILELALPQGPANESRTASRCIPKLSTRRTRLANLVQRRELWLLLMVLSTVLAVGAFQPSFLSSDNLMDIATDAAPVVMIACAAMLVVVTGEIDISVGSLLGLSAATMGMLCYGSQPLMSVPGGILCALLVATGVGALNGILVTFGRVPSIIATLAMLTMLRGAMKLLMQGTSIYGRPDTLRELAIGHWFGLPNSVCLAIAVSAGIAFVAHRTPLGRRIYAVGSNPQAARLLGVSVRKAKLFVFVLSGLLTGVAAVMVAPRNSLIQPNMGSGMELLVITCVVVGGASIQGGRGTIRGTLLAVLLLSLVPTALIFVGAPPEWRMAVQGAFILAAVVIDTLALKYAHATSG